MMSLSVIELAEIRQAELHAYVERERLARQAVDGRRAAAPSGGSWRDELTSLFGRFGAMRRAARATRAELAPAATEST